MCVTNISKRARPVAVANDAMAPMTPSLISQRLMGNFMPLMLNTTFADQVKAPVSTATGNSVEIGFVPAIRNNGSIPVPLNNLPHHELARKETKKPKRRRKPQKPGKTAKQNERHFVVHNYHDHADEPDESDSEEAQKRGGVSISFPAKLHAFLEQVVRDGLSHVVSWQSHGRSFVIHKPKEFADFVMPKYFRQTKLTSFQRQLNLYGFSRLTKGKDCGGYYHELFLRGRPFLTKRMVRTKVKGTKFKAASSPEQEPDFYSMPPVDPSVVTSDDDSLQVDDLNVGSSFEPIPLSAPLLSSLPIMELYPIMKQPAMIQQMNCVARVYGLSYFSNASPEFGQLSCNHVRNQADQILDDAVDELFSDDPLMNDSQALDGLWDTSAFGESVQDDIQLGYMLEKILDV